jgi:hypothetical protein
MKDFFSKFIHTEKFYLLIVWAIACAVMLPILFKGLPYGNDWVHHYQCAYSYYEGILAGDFYPSWSAIKNLGYGGMELRLYPPVSHYSLALFYLVVEDWHIAVWLTVTFFSILGSFGVYWWARELMPARNATFAGFLYALMPYHLNQIYNTFFFAEYVGSAVLPFSFWFVWRVAKRGKPLDIIGLAVAFAGLILTHLPLTVIGSICLLIYGLTLLEHRRFFSQLVKLTVGVLLGLASSSFFWIKVLQERDLIAKTAVYNDPWIDYRWHFLFTPFQMMTDETQIKIYENATYFYDKLFLCSLILVVFCAIPFVVWTKGKEERNLKGIWMIFGLSVFLTAPISSFLWDKLSFLQEVQFSWRWLSVIGMAAAILPASKFNHLIEWFKSRKRPLALIIAGGIFAVIIFSATKVVNNALFTPTNITEITVKSVQKGKGFAFWWTLLTRKEALNNLEKVSTGNREVQIHSWQPTEREFQISSGDGEFARIATFYHPNWKAAVNESKVETRPDENGAILIPISQQAIKVRLSFQETLAQQVGQWISGFAFFLICFLALFEIIRYTFGQAAETVRQNQN